VSFNVLNRKVHYGASAVIAVPALVLISSGLLAKRRRRK
jgi:hypothetical protein